jgi:2-iminobutanoate/2-iminopropanoate deaminase
MQTIQTTSAPSAIGPYSQGIVAGGFLYTAGQIPLVPSTMQLIDGGIEKQTEQVLSNLEAILTAAGVTWDSVVKTTIFLKDLNDFATVNSIYEQRLKPAKPARSTVQVAALPRGVKIEIELIATVK